MKNNTLLLFLLILALVGDVILAWKLYECMQKDGWAPAPTDCNYLRTVNKTGMLDEWNNFNVLNGTTEQNWGVLCKDDFRAMFTDPDVNAVSIYICADNNDPGKTHLYSIGIVGCRLIDGTTPGTGEVITKKEAVYFTAEPWCPPTCYTRTEQ